MKNYEKQYRKFFDNQIWNEAKEVLLEWLIDNPNSTYINGQMAYVLWEMKQYDEAFNYSSKAIALDHIEPLNLWIHSLILESLGFVNQAFNIWDFIVAKPAKIIGEIDSGEGIEWAKGLQVDCLYKMCFTALSKDEFDESATYLRMLKSRLKKGVKSIYSKEDVERLGELLKTVKSI